MKNDSRFCSPHTLPTPQKPVLNSDKAILDNHILILKRSKNLKFPSGLSNSATQCLKLIFGLKRYTIGLIRNKDAIKHKNIGLRCYLDAVCAGKNRHLKHLIFWNFLLAYKKFACQVSVRRGIDYVISDGPLTFAFMPPIRTWP